VTFYSKIASDIDHHNEFKFVISFSTYSPGYANPPIPSVPVRERRGAVAAYAGRVREGGGGGGREGLIMFILFLVSIKTQTLREKGRGREF
jgi:hypothetical protein